MLLLSDYQKMWDNCKLTQDPVELEELARVCKIASVHKPVYEHVALTCNMIYGNSKILWEVVAALHFRESNQDFNCHLYNGDPLTARTVRVPIGRPLKGEPPFSWEESATDALFSRNRPQIWTTADTLQFIERYNGIGYQKHGVNTPYLWDFTDQYSSGLFTSDGSFDPKAKESRPGAAAILKALGFNAPIDSGLH